ncbi:MAG: hypothetical protein ACC742_16430 [Thermoanaerobaculales bacterium]
MERLLFGRGFVPRWIALLVWKKRSEVLAASNQLLGPWPNLVDSSS